MNNSDRNFHLVISLLLLVSLGVDQQEFAWWRAGNVSMVSLGLAMVWFGRYAIQGFGRRDALVKVLRNRLSAVEERVDELERETRARRAPFDT